MKSLLTTVTLLWLLTACQSSNQSKSLPGSDSDTTAVARKPRAQYQIVTLEQNEGKYYGHYKLAVSDFEAKVKQAMDEGWQPVGGVSFIGYIPVQAMIKPE